MLDVSRVGLRVLVVGVLWVSGFACFGVLRLSVVWVWIVVWFVCLWWREVSCFGFGVVAGGCVWVLILFVTFCFAGACY